MAKAAPVSAVIQITALEQLLQQINEAKPEKLLVIDFYASWCMPCKQIGAEMDRLSVTAPYNDLSKIAFLKCDVEEVEEVQEQYAITVRTLRINLRLTVKLPQDYQSILVSGFCTSRAYLSSFW